MAGASSITSAPYPTGARSIVPIRIGGYVPQGLTGAVVGSFKLPWDCEVLGVDLDYRQIGTADIDAIALKTVDGSLNLITAIASPSVDYDAEAQTLHADIVGVTLVKGDKIQLTADTATANEEGRVSVDVLLRPARG